MKDTRPATIFCDIDGTLIEHAPPTTATLPFHMPQLLSGTGEKILEWDKKGYNIILVSGRKESMRSITEYQLREMGIIYDQLILGIGGGKRYLINDRKPCGNEDYAYSINLTRNEGIKDIKI